MTLAEQPQRLFGIALDDDDIRRLVALSRQNACAHLAGNFIDLRKIQNVVDNAHNMDDVTTPVGDNSMQQLARHAPTVSDFQMNLAASVTRGGARAFIETAPLPIS